MKKTIFAPLVLLAAAGIPLSCDNECRVHGYFMEIKNRRSELTVNDVAVRAEDIVNSAELRIKFFCELEYIDVGTYSDDELPCYIKNQGLYVHIAGVSVTCDKAIANIAAGDDLIAIMNPRVYVKNKYDLSVSEWIESFNEGFFHDNFGNNPVLVDIPYEFDIALLPYYVTVVEGDYIFTLTMTFHINSSRPQATYTHTFPSVRLK